MNSAPQTVPQYHMDIHHAKVLRKKFCYIFFFFFLAKVAAHREKCVDEWSSHTMWVADSSGDLGDQFICSASAICWDQSLRCPRRLSTLKESQACAGTGNSAVLQMNQCFGAHSLCRISHYLTVWIRLPPVEFPLIMSDVDYSRPEVALHIGLFKK